ncbi:hypothetical protein ACJW31_06G091300 [Castanea mollissima]
MANSSSPLCERIEQKHTVQRSLETIITLLLLSLLVYRLLSFKDHGFTWLLAFLCELCFTLHWVLNVITKWTPVDYKTYPDRLLQWFLLPPVDMFVTTADPVLEPTIITVNTVLSLLAVDYPANKLACYVSDDGCSPLTLYSLIEASKYANLWVPFCKRNNIQVRAPFRYFSCSCESILPGDHSPGFQIEWKKMKDECQKLEGKLEYAAQNSVPYDNSSEFVPFKNIESRNHPTIIKVILENKGGHSNELPHLLYISREKRSNFPHHYKAGAMNVLTRVSGLMTNAPHMSNVDCDMFANNSQIVLHAVCMMIGFEHESGSAFVQYPQIFYDVPKDDPFGSQMLASLEAAYQVANCGYDRDTTWGNKVGWRYGSATEDVLTGMKIHARGWKSVFCMPNPPGFLGCSSQGGPVSMIQRKRWATGLLEILFSKDCPISATLTANSNSGNAWQGESREIWRIKCIRLWMNQSCFSLKILSGSSLHFMSIKVFIEGYEMECEKLVFNKTGCTGNSLRDWDESQVSVTRMVKRYLLSCSDSVVVTLQLPACFICVLQFGKSPPASHLRVLVAKHNFVQEPASYLFVALFVIRNLYNIFVFLQFGLSIRACYLEFLSVILKLLGLSETVFEVTKKDQFATSDSDNVDAGSFTFDESPIFIPGSTLLIVQLSALVMGLLGLQPPAQGMHGSGLGEVMCSVFVVLCFWPFVKGLFRKGKYGIPLSIICKSTALALLFVLLSRRASMG